MKNAVCLCLLFPFIFAASVAAQRQQSSNPPATASAQLLNAKPVEADPQNSLEQRMTDLSQQISREMSENQKRTVAVVEFVDLRGNVTDFGRFLAEELITRLYQTKKFKVIERQLLNKVVAEQKLSLTGIIDQTSAQRLGQLLGVDAIASGTVTDLGKNLRINARLINTGTGEIFAVASTEIVKDEAVMNLMETGVMPPTSDRSPKSSKLSPTKEAPKKVTVSDFTFEISSCKMAGQTVTCNFTIVNDSSEDKQFGLIQNPFGDSARSSRMFDNLGNEYHAAEAITRRGVRNGPSIASIHLVLVPQVVTKAALKFENVTSDAATIKLLRVTFEVQGNDWAAPSKLSYADFRDVPIVR